MELSPYTRGGGEKTMQSDSCGAKDWGIDRGTDKGGERVGVKSRAGEREREKDADKRQMRGGAMNDKMETWDIAARYAAQ